MKAIALCFSIVFCNPLINSAQQLLNGGFEELYIDSPSISINGVDTFPANWWFGWNAQDCGVFLGSITSESHSGNWAIKLETINCFSGLNGGSSVTRGENPGSQYIPDVLAHEINARPDLIKFYYKYQPLEGDTSMLRALLFNYPDTIPFMDPLPFSYIDTVGFTEVLITGSINTYIQRTANFSYLSSEIPAYILIGIYSNKNAGGHPYVDGYGHAGTTLWMDDIELIYLPTEINDYGTQADIQIFPNPVQDRFQIPHTEQLEIESITLLDYQGRLVKNLNPQNRFHSMAELKSGMYLVQLKTDAGIVMKKLVKE